MGSGALEVSELVESWREQLRPLRARMFPRQVLIELHEDSLRGQVLVDDRPQPVSLDVPLPPLTIEKGVPLEKESLGDLIGDLLVRDGLIDHFVLAALPPAAVQWRVLVWPFEDWPDDPASNLRQIAPPLNLPFDLENAYLDLQPLPGDQSQMLLAAAPKPLVDGGIDVFSLAGVQLERLAPAQSCQLAAIASLMAATPADQLLVLVDPDPPGPCRLLLIRGGVPVFERSVASEGSALVNDLVRSVDFYRRQDTAVRGLRLLLSRPLAEQPQLESRLSVSAEQLSSEPFGSLVLQGLAIPEVMP
jgi:Tfp pilus assembly PilM family ATPase